MDLSTGKSFRSASAQARYALTLVVLTMPLLAPQSSPAADIAPDWVEVESPHFSVVSDAGLIPAQRVALHLERIRSVYQKALPYVRVDSNQPIVVFAVKDEDSLKALIPWFWEREERFRPAGFFRSHPDRHYVVFRVDVTAVEPYSVLNHELFHLVTEMNVPNLPIWLQEGLAGFWEMTEIKGDRVTLGLPSDDYLRVLRWNELMPLAALFDVKSTSPYYQESQKASLFYVQSWALAHYLMIGDETGEAKQQLVSYIQLLQSGVEDREAQRRAFGDLSELEKELESYTHRHTFDIVRMRIPSNASTGQLRVRGLSRAESAAVRGDFVVRGERFLEAKALFDEALSADPNLALAHLGVGFLNLRQGRRSEALPWFDKAIQLGIDSCLAHFYYATLKLDRASSATEFRQIIRSLKRVTKMNPDFAPALTQLAFVYGSRNEHLDEALRLTKRAIELQPTNALNYVNAGQLSLTMNRVEDAWTFGQKGLTVAEKPKTRRLLNSFLNKVGHVGGASPAARSHNTRTIRPTSREWILSHILSPDFSSEP